MANSTAHLLAVARGDVPADLLLANGRLVNVFTGDIEQTDIAIADDRIAGIGPGYTAHQTIDLNGAYVAPGLIDAHVHIESSLCTPPNFAAAVVPRGVTTVIADSHEIANVAGPAGVRYMADAARGLPLRVVQMAPSCVPATPMATSGASLSANDLAALLRDGVVHGLAEVMNFPGVIADAPDVRAKIDAFHGRPIDGHAPGVGGHALNAYVAAGIGTDHECVTPDEARQRLSRGQYLLIREATNAQNLDALLAVVTLANDRRICFCTDDRTPADLLGPGGIDDMVRRAIRFGIDPIDAIRMATLNTAECFALPDRGGIAPGRLADLFIFDDLQSPRAKQVFSGGRDVTAFTPTPPHPRLSSRAEPKATGGISKGQATSPVRDGSGRQASHRDDNLSERPSIAAEDGETLQPLPSRLRIAQPIDLSIALPQGRTHIRVIGSLPNQLVTTERIEPTTIVNGHAVADPSRDILKMAVIERHRGTGNVGLGFIHGFGLTHGAIAGTVAHDHHNLVVIGCDDASMHAAIAAVITMNGGLVVIDAGQIAASLALPVAGLMSDRPITEVRDSYATLLTAAAKLGSTMHDPFMAMSFMALEVIPTLKLTDQGLVDVEKFDFVDLFT
ncbi:MAG TPA: adenine deaminase [Tepidisphaeraceae bacterium]|jgi:adenine deaminase|nr:adenine deaminase [Tepidisphaeraceae bacterium]